MTETSDTIPRPSSAAERFILQWGEMGSRWGVNRSVSQIHAFLYLAGRPIAAEEIAQALGLARSNVSNSLKELLAWRLVRRVSALGDRREYFEAESDLWEMFFRIADGRREREIAPALAALRECVAAAENETAIDKMSKRRLSEMLEFVETMNGWAEQMLKIPRPTLIGLIRMGSRISNAMRPARESKSAKQNRGARA